jgi:hypothetical protein
VFSGDSKLEEVVRAQQSRTPAELPARLLTEISGWQREFVTQQDDITLIVADVI